MVININQIQYNIRMIRSEEFQTAMLIAWKTFLKFEAPEYSTEGIKNFYDFITDERLYKMFLVSNYLVMGAYVDNTMIGMIGMRGNSHISLLFVERDYHKLGIGSTLISKMIDFCSIHKNDKVFTVNASPYATKFYHKLGFSDMEEEKEERGIRYTPMSLRV